MIRLDLKREPHWLDLGHGVRLHVRPCTTALMMAARAEVQHTTSAASTTSESAGLRSAELLKALARLAVLDWEGIGDADGEPAPLTDEATDALLDLWPIASAFESAYLGPALLLDEEKKRLRARAEWHFGGGPEYCGNCTKLSRPCARGEPGADGQRCPYIEHAPLTDAGWQTWDVITRCSGQLRLAQNATVVIGLDLSPALSLATALGYDMTSIAELLPAAEAGLVTAVNERLASQHD